MQSSQSSPAAIDLQRAAAQLQLSELYAERAASDEEALQQLIKAQTSFYRYCRTVEQRLGGSPPSSQAAAANTDLGGRLGELRARNEQLARAAHFERLRMEAEKAATNHRPPGETASAEESRRATTIGVLSMPLFERGTPTHWLAPNATQAPELILEPLAGGAIWYTAFHTIALVVAGLAVGVVVSSPRVLSGLQLLWPEELIVLGGVIWLVFGVEVFAIGIIAIGVAARIVYVRQRLLLPQMVEPKELHAA